MKFLVILACASLALAAPGRKSSKAESRKPREQYASPYADYGAYEYAGLAELPVLPSHYGDAAPSASFGSGASHAALAHGHGPARHVGFSAGGGLVSIARGAADQAHNSVANQHSAAGQAAYVAKNQLAQSAAQSAATAAAALAGKQVILAGLEQQSRDAHVAVDGEKMQLQQAQRAATAAQNSAQQAAHQLQVVTAAMNAAQATSDHAAQAAAEAAAELAAQTSMVGQAKARAQTIDEQLAATRLDFEATRAASEKAAAAAQLAQNNAAAAAAHAAEAGAHATANQVSSLPALPVDSHETDGHEIVAHPSVPQGHELQLQHHHNSILTSVPAAPLHTDSYDYKEYY
ncbi:coiled-coil domain-containing protein 8 homolog [Venturia canescens]|uniref:coiled-coil domain-containing protein 8 homolog n=1 Tax=Venturia canescens TaxID=32260 RepID=UPI001C9BEB0F|nr:coiled-coil domain-containing protein 8 homolog [Venturia canescens]